MTIVSSMSLVMPASRALLQAIHLYVLYFVALAFCTVLYRLSPFHPLARFPGPISWRVSALTLATVSAGGRRHLRLHELHQRYGKFVRIGMSPPRGLTSRC